MEEEAKGVLETFTGFRQVLQRIVDRFITNLPAKKEKNPRFLMVITNRLLKSCTLKAITFIKAEDCGEVFVQCHY
jgi:hypothetical protein